MDLTISYTGHSHWQKHITEWLSIIISKNFMGTPYGC